MTTDAIYIITTTAKSAPDDMLALPETDRFGRVIFRDEATAAPVPVSLIRETLQHHINAMREIIGDAAAQVAHLRIKEVTLKFAIDQKIGCALIAQAGLQAAIEIKLTVAEPTTTPD
jgi:hypothetical protein